MGDRRRQPRRRFARSTEKAEAQPIAGNMGSAPNWKKLVAADSGQNLIAHFPSKRRRLLETHCCNAGTGVAVQRALWQERGPAIATPERDVYF
jgi:hypothetical protein